MKIETTENEFKPIVITVETRDEARYLWHLFNHSEEAEAKFSHYSEVGKPDRYYGEDLRVSFDNMKGYFK